MTPNKKQKQGKKILLETHCGRDCSMIERRARVVSCESAVGTPAKSEVTASIEMAL